MPKFRSGLPHWGSHAAVNKKITVIILNLNFVGLNHPFTSIYLLFGDPFLCETPEKLTTSSSESPEKAELPLPILKDMGWTRGEPGSGSSNDPTYKPAISGWWLSFNPSEKWWSESQLGSWNSQLNGRIKTCSKPPTILWDVTGLNGILWDMTGWMDVTWCNPKNAMDMFIDLRDDS